VAWIVEYLQRQLVGMRATRMQEVGAGSADSTLAGALAVVTAALWAGGLRRGGVRAHLDAVSAEFGRERWTIAVGALVFVAIAIVRLRSSPLLNFEMFGPWVRCEERSSRSRRCRSSG